jgi:hypothetical protein
MASSCFGGYQWGIGRFAEQAALSLHYENTCTPVKMLVE